MGIKKGAIQRAIAEVNEAINVFNIVSLDCEFLGKMKVKDMATGEEYQSCSHRDAVGYRHAISRCQYNRCPFGKEKG